MYNVCMASLFKNSIFFTSATILQKIIAFFYFSFIAKVIGVESTGVYFLVLAVVGIASVFADFGVTNYFIRGGAQKEKVEDIVPKLIGVKMLIIPVAIAAVFVIGHIGYESSIWPFLSLGAVILALDAISVSLFGILRSRQNLVFESIGILIGQTITAGLGAYLLLSGQVSVNSLLFALIAGSAFNAIYGTVVLGFKYGALIFKPQFKWFLSVISASSAFFLATVFTKVYSYADSLIISALLGSFAVGVYAVAYKLTYAFQFFPLAFIAALYPKLSSEFQNREESDRVLKISFEYLSLLAFPIVFGIFSVAEELILFYSTPEFLPAVPVLRVLIFVLLFIFLDFPLGAFLNAQHRHAQKTLVMGLTMVFNVVGNLVLIPLIGIIGAAVAALISFVFMLMADWFFARKLTDLTELDVLKLITPYLLSAVAMAAVVMFAPTESLIIKIAIGGVVYVFGLLIFGKFKDLRKMLRV